ncbi:MAG: ATPase V [Mediterranea sp.]|jgi:V/A-type H+-transporting ATPase subunit I|nr:ATPase V [Mediterranea sp.]
MITKMKKLSFLVYHREYEQFLEQIRELGVVHIVEKQQGEPDESLQDMLQKRALYKNTLSQMHHDTSFDASQEADSQLSADDIITGYEEIQQAIQHIGQQLTQCDKDIAQLTPWGDFDQTMVQKLRDAGWYLQFYTCQERDFQETWETDCNAIRVLEQGGWVYFVTLMPQAFSLNLEPIRLPRHSLSELMEQKAQLQKTGDEYTAKLNDYCAGKSHRLAYLYHQLQSEIDLRTVTLSGERMAKGSVLFLEGWVPEDKETEVRNLLDNNGVYYEMRAAKREDNAPIKLKNNAFNRMYEVLTKMYGMPDYAEFDPTPLIAPFFTLFFGFCMGDAGYGLVLIVLGFLLKKKLSKSLAGMMNLVMTLGVATTIVGALLGTFFGVSLVDVNLPDSVKQFMIVGKIGDTNYDKQMLLAIIIGIVQISFGMTVKAVGETIRFGFKESLSAWGWLLLVVGFVCTGTLAFLNIISHEVSTWAFIVIGGVSAIGIYLLNNIHRNIFVNVGAGLWDTYNMATGLMGDTLSYIRLYALGLAGGMLGGVFNQLAFMVRDSAGGIPGWVFCLLILVLGHGINIAMSCLSAYVHPLRLTFVEYFKNSGYDGKGTAYKPFGVKSEE